MLLGWLDTTAKARRNKTGRENAPFFYLTLDLACAKLSMFFMFERLRMLFSTSKEVIVSEGEFLATVMSRKGRRRNVSVKRLRPARHPTLKVRTFGAVGTIYPTNQMFDQIADEFGGGLYEVKYLLTPKLTLVTNYDVAGEPSVDQQDIDDAQSSGKKKNTDNYFQDVQRELVTGMISRGLESYQNPPDNSKAFDWSQLISVGETFLTNLMQRPAMRQITQDQQQMLAGFVESVMQGFYDSQPPTWVVGQIFDKITPELKGRILSVPIDLAKAWLKNNISAASPATFNVQRQAALAEYTSSAFEQLQIRLRSAA